jgi:lysyl-tRNA synthetase class 2
VHDQLERLDRVRRAVRAHFESQGFLEVFPPVVVPAPGMEPHITAVGLTADDGRTTRPAWLHTSPEFHMKRLLAAGGRRLYALTPVFRAGEYSPHHRLQFTMLEWYRAHETYDVLCLDCEELLARAAHAVHGRTTVGDLDLTPPYERLTLAQAFQRHAGVDLLPYLDPVDGRGLQEAARRAGVSVVPGPDGEGEVELFERAFYEVMLARVEPAIGLRKPTFLCEWPAPLAALSRLSPRDHRVAERVELYAGGLELGNGFGELVDAVEQTRRFHDEQERRRRSGAPVYPVDHLFLADLSRMPPATGMAVGFERLCMVVLGLPDISAAFPLERGD